MENKRLDIPFTRPTPSSDDHNKSMTLWPSKNPQPKETTQPDSSSTPPTSSGAQDSQEGSSSQGGSQSDKK